MNFGDMKTRVAKLIQDPSNTAVSAADVGIAINEAISHWKTTRFWFNEAEDAAVSITAANPVIGDMPSGLLFPLAVGGIVIDYNNLRYPLTKISSSEYDDMNTEATGIPHSYTMRAGAYEVYPYPDQAYTAVVRYLKEYTDLSASTDTNSFTDSASRLIMYEAAGRLSGEFRQDAEMSAYFLGTAEREMRSLMMRTAKVNSTGRLVVYA